MTTVSWTRSGTTIKFDCANLSLSASATLSSTAAFLRWHEVRRAPPSSAHHS
jgi:hypothetical protein